jgi:hypothetical protein
MHSSVRYIHENLLYRFIFLPDGAAAYAVEAAIKNGNWVLWPPISQSRTVSTVSSFMYLREFLHRQMRMSHIYRPV